MSCSGHQSNQGDAVARGDPSRRDSINPTFSAPSTRHHLFWRRHRCVGTLPGSESACRNRLDSEFAEMVDLRDLVVLVTGGSRGIGAAVARAAALAGADVAISYLDRPEEADRVVAEVGHQGRRAMAVGVDLTEPGAARRLVEVVDHEMGRVDALVNNAGVMPETPFLEISDDEWARVIAVDLTAAFVCSQAVLPGMIARGSGSIVMISSRLGQIGWPGVAHYSAAKAGLLGLTKSLAREFGPAGIRVNAVAPGPTITEMSSEMLTGETGQRRAADLPAGRFARPEDVAESVMFLLSDAASMYHGQTLCPNGGGHMP
jgi:3-oxoacyl-[acyl-carrier protein] reductase